MVPRAKSLLPLPARPTMPQVLPLPAWTRGPTMHGTSLYEREQHVTKGVHMILHKRETFISTVPIVPTPSQRYSSNPTYKKQHNATSISKIAFLSPSVALREGTRGHAIGVNGWYMENHKWNVITQSLWSYQSRQRKSQVSILLVPGCTRHRFYQGLCATSLTNAYNRDWTGFKPALLHWPVVFTWFWEVVNIGRRRALCWNQVDMDKTDFKVQISTFERGIFLPRSHGICLSFLSFLDALASLAFKLSVSIT